MNEMHAIQEQGREQEQDRLNRIMPTEYDAQMLKLRLPEQAALKNDAERCSADPVMLKSIGGAVGHQVRINRKDDPRFIALYTVKQPNPPADLTDPSRANVVRTGQAGRERLGTSAEMKVVIHASVVDTAPRPCEPIGVRFFEVAEDDGKQAYLIAIAPHGGEIEKHTDEEAACLREKLISKGYPASAWICKGYGDKLKRASGRWHITSTDLHPASFPLLRTLITRKFRYGVAFHGFLQQPGEADVYIGGGAAEYLKKPVKKALEALGLPIKIKIAAASDNPKFQGYSADNIVNRLAVQGVHIEQSREAREHSKDIAKAVASVFCSN
jgi:phage replication-related protein YjqB (UPF0714/DUF867 family)